MIYVCTNGEAVVVRPNIITFVAQVTKRSKVSCLLRTTGNTSRSIHLLTYLKDSVRPRFHIIHTGLKVNSVIELTIIAYKLSTGCLPKIIDFWQTFAGIKRIVNSLKKLCLHVIGIRTLHAVVDTHPTHFKVFSRIGNYIVEREQTHVCTILHVNINLALFTRGTFLRSNEDDAICTTRTVKRSSGCVFKNGR